MFDANLPGRDGEASLELNQAPEGGSRFPVDARLDGRSFVKFHVSTEQHWAEKLHAYTLPRDGATNSRVKDLVDLALLIELQSMSPTRINAAVGNVLWLTSSLDLHENGAGRVSGSTDFQNGVDG